MDKIKIIQISTLLALFLVGYSSLNYFVLKFFGANSILFTILVSIPLPISIILGQRRSSLAFQVVYAFSMIWLGFILFLLWGVLILSIIGLFIHPPPIAHGILLILGVSITLYAVFNGMRVHVKKLELTIRGLDNDITLVHLSDLHIGPLRDKKFLKHVGDKIKDLNPDAILITGDFVDGFQPINRGIFEVFNFGVPIFFVSGNHDTYMGLESLFDSLEAGGFAVIDQRIVKFNGVQIIGVGYMHKNMLEGVFEKLDFDPDKPSILLHHLPIGWEVAREYGIDLQLSGHTHGGQFYPFNILVGLMFPYLKGLYENSGSYLYVSQGTGTWGPPMRLGSCNEIALIKLKGAPIID